MLSFLKHLEYKAKLFYLFNVGIHHLLPYSWEIYKATRKHLYIFLNSRIKMAVEDQSIFLIHWSCYTETKKDFLTDRAL